MMAIMESLCKDLGLVGLEVEALGSSSLLRLGPNMFVHETSRGYAPNNLTKTKCRRAFPSTNFTSLRSRATYRRASAVYYFCSGSSLRLFTRNTNEHVYS